MLKKVNFTHICLIFKVPYPEMVNVVYKIFSKAIAKQIEYDCYSSYDYVFFLKLDMSKAYGHIDWKFI